ncbi:MAG TPA: hypothetical protein VMJ93_06430 [Verrucomicrobiae bacterium]|nr:hypothetical protein [Verrucomicrobiae bacterium]
MRKAAFIGLLIGTLSWGQEAPVVKPPAQSQASQQQTEPAQSTPAQPQPQAGTQAPDGAPPQTLVVPAGTRVPLALANPVRRKTMKAGDPIRAVVTFPVTVGAQVMIPVNTFVEGEIDSVTGYNTPTPTLRAHFTKMIFANGYVAPIESSVAMSQPFEAGETGFELASFTPGSGQRFELAAAEPQQQPPPLKSVGPSGGQIALFVALPVVGIVLLVLAIKHNQGLNWVVLHTGYQFDMVMDAPVTLDASQVAAAMAATPPPAQ